LTWPPGIDVFVDEPDLSGLGFEGAQPEATGRPAYHPASLLKIHIYGCLNRIQSSRRLERETQRNVELICLTGRLTPDFKTAADFRRDNGKAIRGVCREFIVMCRDLKLFSEAIVAIDGSKFKAVNNREKNFTDRSRKSRRSRSRCASSSDDRVDASVGQRSSLWAADQGRVFRFPAPLSHALAPPIRALRRESP
jgi:transposase